MRPDSVHARYTRYVPSVNPCLPSCYRSSYLPRLFDSHVNHPSRYSTKIFKTCGKAANRNCGRIRVVARTTSIELARPAGRDSGPDSEAPQGHAMAAPLFATMRSQDVRQFFFRPVDRARGDVRRPELGIVLHVEAFSRNRLRRESGKRDTSGLLCRFLAQCKMHISKDQRRRQVSVSCHVPPSGVWAGLLIPAPRLLFKSSKCRSRLRPAPYSVHLRAL
jgi:hypothetical protein